MKKKKQKTTNWSKALKKSLAQEKEADAREIIELVRRIHYLLIEKRR